MDPVLPPTGAPNVVVVVIDDMGFGAPSAFGGPCQMPAAERLAAGGLRYSRFHVTALCSPTRQALLTGRNHHSVGMGVIAEMATPVPGYTSVRPQTAATIAQTLRGNGYNTAAFGKMHQTPTWESGPMGPFDRWPTGDGFEKFYGFIGAEMNHWRPLLYEGTRQLPPPPTRQAGYHLSEDLVDQAISWLRMQRSLAPERPFFLYLPFGATHAPHHVPEAWRARYAGAFDHGWNAQRERTFARQKAEGLIPPDADLPAWTRGVPEWDDLSPIQRRVASAMMENYAAFAEHTDAQTGRLIDELTELGVLDNTLVFYLLGDNGASPEGGLEGTLNELRACNAIEDTPQEMVAALAKIGSEESYPNYPAGWALAMNTPYPWSKPVASHYGGTRDGMIVHWPAGIERGSGLRHQWHHVIDVAPTILEAAGIPAPRSVDGVDQQPIEGVSMAYSFADEHAPGRHTVQYFEMLGNRAVYADGWMASAKHRTPWQMDGPLAAPLSEDRWELYDLTRDWTQAHDLAEEHPDKLQELQDLFLIEAARHQVLPLDDSLMERVNPALAGRPDVLRGRRSVTLRPGGDLLLEDVAPNLKNRSFTVAADLELDGEATGGVVIAQGGRFGGWSLYLVDGRPRFAYNFLGLETSTTASNDPLGPGACSLELRFDYDGGGVGAGGTATIRVDGRAVATDRVPRTIPYWLGPNEALGIGRDLGTPVSSDYADDFAFEGQINSVRIDVEPDDPTQPPPDAAELPRQ
jgi:arylsulfatase A-like enzyme